MPLVLTPDALAGRRLLRQRGHLAFTARTHVSVLMSELTSTVSCYPLAFLDLGPRVTLVALLGLVRDRNLFVSPEGDWVGGYQPARFRRHPFVMVTRADGARALALENDAPLIDAADPRAADPDAAIALFDDDGRPTPAFERMRRFAERLDDEGRATDAAAGRLKAAGVLREWPIKLTVGDHEEVIASYLRLDESALWALGDRAFLSLRRSGALPLAYAQLLSMRNLRQLAWMHRLRESVEGGAVQGLPAGPLAGFEDATGPSPADALGGDPLDVHRGSDDSFDFADTPRG